MPLRQIFPRKRFIIMSKVVKADIVERLANRLEVNKVEAERFLNAYHDEIRKIAIGGESYTVTGLFTLEQRVQEETTRRNPQTGETFIVPTHRDVKLRASKTLRNDVKNA